MTVVLDAQAVIAYLVGEPGGKEVRRLLEERDAAISTVNLAEVVDVAARLHGIPPDESRAALRLLIRAGLRAVACDEGHGWAAGELRATHYHRRRRALSIPDCILVATANEGDSIATGDAAVIAVARHEGVGVIPLLDSAGRRPR